MFANEINLVANVCLAIIDFIDWIGPVYFLAACFLTFLVGMFRRAY